MTRELGQIKDWLSGEVGEVVEHFKGMDSETIGKEFAYGNVRFVINNQGCLVESRIMGYRKASITCILQENGDLVIEASAFHHAHGALKESYTLHDVAAFEYLEDFFEKEMKRLFGNR